MIGISIETEILLNASLPGSNNSGGWPCATTNWRHGFGSFLALTASLLRSRTLPVCLGTSPTQAAI
jgi:hypothetical protein